MPTYDYQCETCGVMEIFHGIMEDPKTVCPECGSSGLVRLISAGAAVIDKNRQMCQYNDVTCSKFWRDDNGNRHKVLQTDGHRKSLPRGEKKTRSQSQIDAMIKRRKLADKQCRTMGSYNRFVKQVKNKKGK